MAINDLLKSCPIFFELYDHEIEKVVKSCKVSCFSSGDYIIKQGDEGNEIYVLLNGTVAVQRDLEEKSVEVEVLSHGNIFGFVVLVEEQKYSESVVAKDSADVLCIPFDHLLSFYKTDPGIFGIITLNLSRIMAQRLDTFKQKIYDKTIALEKLHRNISKSKVSAHHHRDDEDE